MYYNNIQTHTTTPATSSREKQKVGQRGEKKSTALKGRITRFRNDRERGNET